RDGREERERSYDEPVETKTIAALLSENRPYRTTPVAPNDAELTEEERRQALVDRLIERVRHYLETPARAAGAKDFDVTKAPVSIDHAAVKGAIQSVLSGIFDN